MSAVFSNCLADRVAPFDSYIAKTKTIDLDKSVGRISAASVTIYPPGVPILYPGQLITDATLKHIKSAHKAGNTILGLSPEKGLFIEVLSGGHTSSRYQITTLTSDQISTDMAYEIADFFAAGFASEPYNHFAFHKSQPLQSWPPHHEFTHGQSLERQDWYHLAELEAIDLTGTGYHRWVDKKICRQQTVNRLQDPGYITIVIDRLDGSIKGLLHARTGSLERIYQTEEWANPLLFSADAETSTKASDDDEFYQKMRYHFGLGPHSQICTISCQLLHPDIRGGEIFFTMMRNMAQQVSFEHASLPLLTEIPDTGTAHIINAATTDRLVYGVLCNGHPVVYADKVSNALFYYLAPTHYFWKRAVAYQAGLSKGRLRPHPLDNPSVEIRDTPRKGRAVFATDKITAGETIAVFTGETYCSNSASALPEVMVNHALQIGPNEFVHAQHRLAELINHSCEPNCGIRNFTHVFAVRDIKPGEEITWDYRCTEDSDWVLDECNCGSKRCTGIVRGYSSLPTQVQNEYLSKGMVSQWIRNNN